MPVFPCGEASGLHAFLVVAFRQRHGERHWTAVTDDLEIERLAVAFRQQSLEVAHTVDRFPVDRHDQIPDFDTEPWSRLAKRPTLPAVVELETLVFSSLPERRGQAGSPDELDEVRKRTTVGDIELDG